MWGRLPAAFLLFAMICASLVPAGWMPSVGNDGQILLVICTGHGVEERWVDVDDGNAPVEQMEDRSCPFGATAEPDALAGSFSVFITMATLGESWSQNDFTHRSAGFDWRYDARGPPSLS
jgi:hypothetical protein